MRIGFTGWLSAWLAAPVAIGLAGCEADTGQAALAPVEVEVVPVARRDVPLTLEMVGTTLGNQDVPIRARVEGFLESVEFREGTFVNRGDLLYTIDAQPFQARVVEAQSQLAAAQTGFAKARADLDRIAPLAAINAVSQQQLDAAEAQEAAARAAVQAAEAAVELAEIELGYTRIFAPIDGLIGLTQAKPGEFVGREPNPVVLNMLSDIDPIRVRFSISEREYLVLARTMVRADELVDRDGDARPADTERKPLTLILADGSEYERAGFADATAQSIDPATGTFTIEATFPNPDRLLLPGQFARVRADYQTLEQALVVPRRALVELQGRYRVYVVTADGTVELRPVELGPVKDNDVVIESGVEAGERVVVEGTQKVRDGMNVAASDWSPPPAPGVLQET